MKRIPAAIAAIVFGLIFSVVGYLIAYKMGVPVLESAKASETWPKVEGKITKSEVETSRNREGKTMYSSAVAYEYDVEGTTYSNDRVWFGDDYSSSSRSDAQQTVSQYKTGQQVDVYYQPDDPRNAVLEPGAHFSSYLLFGLGWIFLGIGILISGGFLFRIVGVLFMFGYASQKSGNSDHDFQDSPGAAQDDDFVENL